MFDISSTIQLEESLELTSSNVTIAGQTAPSDGITLRDHTFKIKNCSDAVFRYIRVRLGDASKTSSDTVAVEYSHDVIFGPYQFDLGSGWQHGYGIHIQFYVAMVDVRRGIA